MRKIGLHVLRYRQLHLDEGMSTSWIRALHLHACHRAKNNAFKATPECNVANLKGCHLAGSWLGHIGHVDGIWNLRPDAIHLLRRQRMERNRLAEPVPQTWPVSKRPHFHSISFRKIPEISNFKSRFSNLVSHLEDLFWLLPCSCHFDKNNLTLSNIDPKVEDDATLGWRLLSGSNIIVLLST